MALVKVWRAAQITLPAEVRQKLQVQEGDYLEAEVVEDGVLLKPFSRVEREKAWQRVLDAPKSVRYIGPEPRPSPEEEEEWLAEEIRAACREKSTPRAVVDTTVHQCLPRPGKRFCDAPSAEINPVRHLVAGLLEEFARI